MARVSTYLNFMGDAEEALDFYRTIFDTDYLTPIARMADLPWPSDGPQLAEDERNKIMHAELAILAGHVIMATDMLKSLGHERRLGNNMTINLELEDRKETERLFGLLSEGGQDISGLAEMPWGAYWGTCQDRFGIRWMFNCRI